MTEVLGAVLGNHNVFFVYQLFPRGELHSRFESQYDTGLKHCIVAWFYRRPFGELHAKAVPHSPYAVTERTSFFEFLPHSRPNF